jgi:hypothetical protein
MSNKAGKATAFRRNRLAAAIGITGMMLVAGVSGSAFAAKGGVPGKPTNGGGGGAPELGDLIVLYRDAWGLPILTGDLCQQPLAAPGVRFDIDIDGTPTECTPEDGTDSCAIPVDPTTCAIVAGYDMYTQETDFGRTSVIRSPDTVLQQSLGEVVTKLATAQCTSLDPAGRPVNTSMIDGVVSSATIDSPLESLAIYWQLMRTGYLGATPDAIDLPQDSDVLDMAARGLGAAADKTGKVTVDQVVYSNQIMGLTDENVQTYLPKICMTVREEVSGTVQAVRKCFLNYGPPREGSPDIGGTSADYQYDRAANFGALPTPPYIPKDDPTAGVFEYLGVYSTGTPTLFQIVQADITSTVFESNPDLEASNIGGFTQAADDAREVIEFTHDRPLPLDYETAVPLCDNPDTDLDYDVSISGESGLQVPKRMVAGAEEPREIIVTVANAGPDTAIGSVTLIGEDSNGGEVFNESAEFEIEGGDTDVSEWGFSLDYPTTVSWTATAYAVDDLNTGNNTVYATTKVMTTGGGGNNGGQGGQASASSKGKSGK